MLLPLWRRQIEQAVKDGRSLQERRVGKIIGLVAVKSNEHGVVIVDDLDERQYKAIQPGIVAYWNECEKGKAKC